ncbi:MAG: hypothetical protein IVW53_10735 [Chloroflexi bacterium]|nr:hypothetical protein [Chloroflexota bacterium]
MQASDDAPLRGLDPIPGRRPWREREPRGAFPADLSPEQLAGAVLCRHRVDRHPGSRLCGAPGQGTSRVAHPGSGREIVVTGRINR